MEGQGLVPTEYDENAHGLDATDSIETVTVEGREGYTDADGEEKVRWGDIATIEMNIQPIYGLIKALPPAIQAAADYVAYSEVSAYLVAGGQIRRSTGTTLLIKHVANWNSHMVVALARSG